MGNDLYDKSLDQAKRELKQGQKFEIAYTKFFHKAEDSEPNTYFNAFGPIACLGSCYPNAVADQQEIYERVDGCSIFIWCNRKYYTRKGTMGLAPGLIYSYGNALREGAENVKRLSDALLPGLN